jgi:hypothetical protein
MKRWWASESGALRVTVVGGVIVGCILIVPYFFSDVLAAIAVEKIKPYLAEDSSGGETKAEKKRPSGNDRERESGPSLDPILTLDFRSLLGEHREGERIAKLFPALGPAKDFDLREGGVEICFRSRGLHFLFDRENLLDKVIFYARQADDHFHLGYGGRLPLDLRFTYTREDTQTQIDSHEHAHQQVELGTGEYDKVEIPGCRLYLRYGTFDGENRIREVQLVRPEKLVQEQAALSG